jgi:hypothetical protein
MIRKIPFVILVLAILFVPALVASGDSYVWVVVQGGPVGSITGTVPLAMLGGTLYYTQEDALAAFNEAAGTSVSNWYLWVCLNGACVPVDPYTVGS